MKRNFMPCFNKEKLMILLLVCGFLLCGCSNAKPDEKTDASVSSAHTASAVPDVTAGEDSDEKIEVVSATAEPVPDEDSDSDIGALAWEWMWAVDKVTETELRVYPLFYEAVDIDLEMCKEELMPYDIIEINFDGGIMETWPGQLSQIYSIEKLSEDEIAKLTASDWKSESAGGDGTYMYAIIVEIREYEGKKSALIYNLENQEYIGRARIPNTPLATGEEAEEGDIIRIDYDEMEYDEEAKEYRFGEIYSINKIR